MIPLTHPQDHSRVIGWDVPYLSPPYFATEEEARYAIDKRIGQVVEELMRHQGIA